jgi:hypothetical protein
MLIRARRYVWGAAHRRREVRAGSSNKNGTQAGPAELVRRLEEE